MLSNLGSVGMRVVAVFLMLDVIKASTIASSKR